MIISFLLTVFFTFVAFMVGFLPEGHLPTEMSNAFAFIMSAVNSFSFVIPVDTILQAILLVLAFDGVLILWRFINWVIRKIPGMQ